jgi:hypothetical protein
VFFGIGGGGKCTTARGDHWNCVPLSLVVLPDLELVGVGKNLGENNKGTDQTVIGTNQPASQPVNPEKRRYRRFGKMVPSTIPLSKRSSFVSKIVVYTYSIPSYSNPNFDTNSLFSSKFQKFGIIRFDSMSRV